MTDVAVASTRLCNREAGEDLAKQIRTQLGEGSPDAVIVFASSQNDYEALLGGLDATSADLLRHGGHRAAAGRELAD